MLGLVGAVSSLIFKGIVIDYENARFAKYEDSILGAFKPDRPRLSSFRVYPRTTLVVLMDRSLEMIRMTRKSALVRKIGGSPLNSVLCETKSPGLFDERVELLPWLIARPKPSTLVKVGVILPELSLTLLQMMSPTLMLVFGWMMCRFLVWMVTKVLRPLLTVLRGEMMAQTM